MQNRKGEISCALKHLQRTCTYRSSNLFNTCLVGLLFDMHILLIFQDFIFLYNFVFSFIMFVFTFVLSCSSHTVTFSLLTNNAGGHQPCFTLVLHLSYTCLAPV